MPALILDSAKAADINSIQQPRSMVTCFMRAQRSKTATRMVKSAHHMQVQK